MVKHNSAHPQEPEHPWNADRPVLNKKKVESHTIIMKPKKIGYTVAFRDWDGSTRHETI